ncbi:anti-sigma-I factor RsgI6-like isoform X1 [Haliotis rubra]|uniref:anti-sigma-I factor RsgI6-like isoform X1 n=1 Tax=Haliotis rubra TaxID=36100 RepID=UPI001EE62D38|nr:anti-sigma-I factor RsgI6-like isoform X1 [Haliotis rubra]
MSCLVLLCLLPLALGQNIVQNGNMETMDHWNCWNIHCELTTDHHSGQHGIKATGRNHYYEGPSQTLNGLKANGRYKVEGWIKLLNDQAGHLGQNVELEVSVDLNTGKTTYIAVASHPLARTSDGWIHLTGDFNAPAEGIKSSTVYYQGPSPSVNFVVDSVSVTPLVANTHWRAESDATIERMRKSDMNFHVTTSGGISDNQVEIDVIQTKKSFAFGTVVDCKEYLNGDQRYINFLNKHFNWGVTGNALKWDLMEPQKGQIDYDTGINAVKKLRSNGIKVRAHNIVWSVDQFVPWWVKPLRGQTLKDTVKHRIQDIVGRTKNLVEHWDVDNENLHGFWFQNTLNDRDYNLEIFRIAHQAGPNVKMFLNDYSVVSSGGMTGAYRDQAIRFKNANVGLGGVGAQCHFGDNVEPDPTLIKEHLDTIGQAGVPIWITELDVTNSDEHKRADWYETALRAFYGHPAVGGVMFWGFWSERHWRGDAAAMVSGNEFRLNAAGQRFLDLTEKTWMTNETHKLSQSGKNFKVRGFHGDYTIKVKVNGKEVTSLAQSFTLGKSAHTVNLRVHH